VIDAPTHAVTVIGIGNTLMGDDGVGVRVAEELLAAGVGPGAEVVVGSVAGMSLVGHLLDSRHVIFVDAIDAGDEPGSIFRFDPDDVGVSNLRSNTIHGMSVSYLVTSARMSGARPDVIVYGVQVADVSCCPDMLSPPVEDAAVRVIELVAEEVAGILARGE
jgi:hydrogenase maturation protease